MDLIYISLYIFIFIFGAIIGSFLNVVIYRLPKANFLKSKRSYCPHCETQIKAYDLIPILSYLILRGKCRNCGKKISPQYPLVEFFMGSMAVFSAWRFGFGLEAVIVFGVLAVFIAITVIDFETMEIPNALVIALIPFAIAAIFVFKDIDLISRGIGFFSVSVPLLILAVLVKSSFGGGDIKLMAVCGFLLGLPNTLVCFFIALLFGGGYAIFLLISGKRKKAHIAFGPYICLGATVALFYGNEILRWYLGFF